MTVLLFLLALVCVGILYISYMLFLYPRLRLYNMKKTYGNKINVFFHYGKSLLMLYRKGYVEKNDSMNLFRNMHTKELQAFGFNIGPKVGLSFLDPELIKQVHYNHDQFSKLDISQAMGYLFSQSLIYQSGKEWQRQRQFLGKSFHFDEIKNYLTSIKDVCVSTFGVIDEELQITPKKEIQVVRICEKVTSEVVFRVFFGSSSENLTITKEDGTKLALAHELVSAITDSFRLLQTSKYSLIKHVTLSRKSLLILPSQEEKKLLARLKAIQAQCLKVIETRKAALLKDSTLYKKNFLDLYLREIIENSNKDITFEEIIDNFLALFFAGTDTTGNMTGIALYYLAKNPQIQHEAREEIKKVLSQRTDSKNPNDMFNALAFEDLAKINLVTSILKESLRIVPPTTEVFPRLALQDIKIGDFLVQKGDLVNTHFIYNQSNPSIYPNPEVFDPSRWMNGNENQNVFNFTPFSLGPRNCIGQHLAMVEGKCMLVNLLLNFDILPIPDRKTRLESKVIYGFNPDNLVYFKKRMCS